ncbi:MAG: DUF4386 domain-containing protein [Anaerolineae bacterium]|nr:DUF4386 domain-containing protein [Anaerolineae bacterium]
MLSLPLRRMAGLLLIVVPIVFTVCFTLLQMQFEYPDILRQPAGDVLVKFQAGGGGLVAVWYVLTLSAVLFIPLSVLVHAVLASRETSVALWVATVFGVVAGVVQALGFARWPFLVPYLAQTYTAPGTTPAQRETVGLLFEAFNRYAGMAVGEQLGYLSTSVWTLLVAWLMVRSPWFGRWVGLSGMALAVGIAAGLLEPFGWGLGGVINAISYLAWAVWLVVVGIVLVVRRVPVAAGTSAVPAGR